MSLPKMVKLLSSSVAVVGSAVGVPKMLYSSPTTSENGLSASLEPLIFASEEEKVVSQPTVTVDHFSDESQVTEVESTPYNTPSPEEELEKQRQKELSIEAAKKAHKVLDDYTFKILGPCNTGTGWVLDYVLPDKEGAYPTTWYIGTAAHVVKEYRFGDNPYEQLLHVSDDDTWALRRRYRYSQMGFSEFNMFANICQNVDWYGYFDLALVRQNSDYGFKNSLGLYMNKKIKEPKLFYLPVNFLDKDESLGVKKDNYKDFAVLEIEFTDEKYAREVTNNFADKYPVESTDALNIFSKPLKDRYSEETLNGKHNEEYYSLGYPYHLKYDYATPYDWNKAEGLTLSRDSRNRYSNKDKPKLNGHINANRVFGIDWAGTKREAVGSFYLLESNSSMRSGGALIGGTSGSLAIDKEGNIIGVHSGGEVGPNKVKNSFFTPLRQDKIEGGEGELRSPKYDLILGTDGQKGSYKEQVEKYNKKTWLQARGWQHKTKDSAGTLISK